MVKKVLPMEYIGFKVEKQIKEEAMILAKNDGRSLSNLILKLLKEHIESKKLKLDERLIESQAEVKKLRQQISTLISRVNFPYNERL